MSCGPMGGRVPVNCVASSLQVRIWGCVGVPTTVEEPLAPETPQGPQTRMRTVKATPPSHQWRPRSLAPMPPLLPVHDATVACPKSAGTCAYNYRERQLNRRLSGGGVASWWRRWCRREFLMQFAGALLQRSHPSHRRPVIVRVFARDLPASPSLPRFPLRHDQGPTP
jgi:hypothetical protein